MIWAVAMMAVAATIAVTLAILLSVDYDDHPTGYKPRGRR